MINNAMPAKATADRNSLQYRFGRTALVLAMLLVVLGIALVAANPFERRPDLFLVRQIQKGMTEAEVATIFGDSPTTTTPWQVDRLYVPTKGQGVAKYWYCDAGLVRVFFGNDGRVVSVNQHRYDREVENPTMTKIREFLRRIGLL
jgi:hypothetical protein